MCISYVCINICKTHIILYNFRISTLIYIYIYTYTHRQSPTKNRDEYLHKIGSSLSCWWGWHPWQLSRSSTWPSRDGSSQSRRAPCLSEIGVPLKSSILRGFSIVIHFGVPLFQETPNMDMCWLFLITCHDGSARLCRLRGCEVHLRRSQRRSHSPEDMKRYETYETPHWWNIV